MKQKGPFHPKDIDSKSDWALSCCAVKGCNDSKGSAERYCPTHQAEVLDVIPMRKGKINYWVHGEGKPVLGRTYTLNHTGDGSTSIVVGESWSMTNPLWNDEPRDKTPIINGLKIIVTHVGTQPDNTLKVSVVKDKAEKLHPADVAPKEGNLNPLQRLCLVGGCTAQRCHDGRYCLDHQAEVNNIETPLIKLRVYSFCQTPLTVGMVIQIGKITDTSIYTEGDAYGFDPHDEDNEVIYKKSHELFKTGLYYTVVKEETISDVHYVWVRPTEQVDVAPPTEALTGANLCLHGSCMKVVAAPCTRWCLDHIGNDPSVLRANACYLKDPVGTMLTLKDRLDSTLYIEDRSPSTDNQYYFNLRDNTTFIIGATYEIVGYKELSPSAKDIFLKKVEAATPKVDAIPNGVIRREVNIAYDASGRQVCVVGSHFKIGAVVPECPSHGRVLCQPNYNTCGITIRFPNGEADANKGTNYVITKVGAAFWEFQEVTAVEVPKGKPPYNPQVERMCDAIGCMERIAIEANYCPTHHYKGKAFSIPATEHSVKHYTVKVHHDYWIPPVGQRFKICVREPEYGAFAGWTDTKTAIAIDIPAEYYDKSNLTSLEFEVVAANKGHWTIKLAERGILSLDIETDGYKTHNILDYAIKASVIPQQEQTMQIYTGGTVIRTKMVVAGEGVSQGVQVTEVVYSTSESFVAANPEMARTKVVLKALAEKAITAEDVDSQIAPISVKLNIPNA